MKIFIQIGTNSGNDSFRNLVIKESPDLVLLVEPNENLIETIKNNYMNIKNVNIINKAVGYEDEKEVSLYIPAINKIYGNKGENNFTYVDAHFSLLPMNDWGEKENMIEIKTKSITFNTMCSAYNINEIDYLQIDTEGFDTEIIKMIDFDKINIKKLRYEKWSFDPSCFTKYHSDKYEQLGKNGLKIIEDKLIKHGYELNDISDDDGNDILATKKIFYSQCQEDKFLNENYFKNKKNGTYIELGALDGVLYSNTKFFEDSLNWNGVLIEPHPIVYGVLKKNRPNNYLFNDLVSCLEEELNFKFFLNNIYLYAISGIADTLPQKHYDNYFNNNNSNYLEKSIYIKPKTLREIIKSTDIKHFDLLSLDVEGHEYEVLNSWDFSVPIDVIMFEVLDENDEKGEMCRKLLIENGYIFDCRFCHNEIFILNNFIKPTNEKKNKYIITKKSTTLEDALNKYFACVLFCIKYNYEYILEENCPKIEDYIYYKGVDHCNDDIECVNPNIDNLKNICNKNDNAICFNTLGYIKSDFIMNKLTSNDYINEKNNHGLYVKNIININDNNYFKHYNNCKINNLIMDGYFHFDEIYLEHKNEILNFIKKNNHKINVDNNYFFIKDLINNSILNNSKLFLSINSKENSLNLIDNNLFYVKNKDTYPPFKNGNYMEEYFLKYMVNNNLKYDKNNRLYIPCLWTNFQIESWFDAKKEEMQNILDNYILNNNCENGYFTVVQYDDGPKLKLPENTLTYGACNGNVKLPLIYEDNENKLENISKMQFKQKNILCSFIGKNTHNVRYIIHNKFINNLNFNINVKNNWSSIVNDNDQNNFISATVNSKFALAPRGYGKSSFRFFEILKLGTIPIYVWDDIEWLPYMDIIDYSKICISININNIDNLENILLNIDENKYNEMINNYDNIKYIFCLEFMAKYIVTK